MRTFSVIGVMVLFFLSAACTTSEDNLTAPPLPTGMSGENGFITNAEQCHTNMTTMADQAVIFYAENGRYPRDQEEMEMGGVTCPECGEEYTIVADEYHFYIGCPLPFSPNHGYVYDGVASWPEQEEQWQNMCRSNMRTIASHAVIFFAENGRYPRDQEEMGMSGVVCPECGEEYDIIGDGDYFYVGCPLPFSPNHGNIDDGIVSWPEEPQTPEEEQNACRANMMTIASQAVIFFACYERYPRNLEEIDMSGTVCPTCGQEYELIGGDDYFYVECPLPFSPDHGNIDNGVASWHDPETDM